jgi:hypothetical protein
MCYYVRDLSRSALSVAGAFSDHVAANGPEHRHVQIEHGARWRACLRPGYSAAWLLLPFHVDLGLQVSAFADRLHFARDSVSD